MYYFSVTNKQTDVQLLRERRQRGAGVDRETASVPAVAATPPRHDCDATAARPRHDCDANAARPRHDCDAIACRVPWIRSLVPRWPNKCVTIVEDHFSKLCYELNYLKVARKVVELF